MAPTLPGALASAPWIVEWAFSKESRWENHPQDHPTRSLGSRRNATRATAATKTTSPVCHRRRVLTGVLFPSRSPRRRSCVFSAATAGFRSRHTTKFRSSRRCRNRRRVETRLPAQRHRSTRSLETDARKVTSRWSTATRGCVRLDRCRGSA